MATFSNPANDGRELNVPDAGTVSFDRFTFNLAASYASGYIADESLLLIGYVPAACAMVRHLSRLEVPQLDDDGAPTGDFEVGTAADPDALTASAAAETAVVFFGEDWKTDAATGVIGSATERTPIYLRVSNVIASAAATGVITFDLAFRSYRSAIGG